MLIIKSVHFQSDNSIYAAVPQLILIGKLHCASSTGPNLKLNCRLSPSEKLPKKQKNLPPSCISKASGAENRRNTDAGVDVIDHLKIRIRNVGSH